MSKELYFLLLFFLPHLSKRISLTWLDERKTFFSRAVLRGNTPNSRKFFILSWLIGILSKARANSASVWDLLEPLLSQLIGVQRAFTLQMPYDVWHAACRSFHHSLTFPLLISSFYLTEGDILWNVNSLLGSQTLNREFSSSSDVGIIILWRNLFKCVWNPFLEFQNKAC